MDARPVLPLDHPALARRSAIAADPLAPPHRMVDAVRALVIDAIGAAKPDRPELASGVAEIGMADVATALWTRFHKFDAADPRWPDRDRFVLSAGHRSLLLRALVHLTGHDAMSIDDIGAVGPADGAVASYAGHAGHPAIETTSAAPGHGLATGVGMALAERNMAARFGKSLVDHRTWVFVSDDDLMAGISHEAAALAGHLGLSKLVVLYHDDRGSIDAGRALFCSDDVLKRFSAYGWATRQVDGDDPAQINAALSFAVRSRKPSLIACHAANPPNPAHAAPPGSAPGAPPGRTAAAGARQRGGWHDRPLATPADVAQRWHAAGSRGAAARRSWLKRLARHNQRGEFERVMSGRLPDTWHEALADLKQRIADRPAPIGRPPRHAPRHAPNSVPDSVPDTMSGRGSGSVPDRDCLDTLVAATPELIGGSAGSVTASGALAKPMAPIAVGNYGGRHIHYGMREPAMAAAANGMALHGGIIPYVATSAAFADSLRPALRMAATMRQRVVYVLTEDAAGIGRDGAIDRSIEHLAGLRAMPNLHVQRPADSMETAECWELALRRADGPSVLVLPSGSLSNRSLTSRSQTWPARTLPASRTDVAENRCARGGYILAEAERPRHATIIATGSEVPIAMAARDQLAGGNIAAAVVSLPCWEQFALQDAAYRDRVLGAAPRFGVEAASGFGWAQWLGPDGAFIGLSAPAATGGHPELDADPAIAIDAVVATIMRHLVSRFGSSSCLDQPPYELPNRSGH